MSGDKTDSGPKRWFKSVFKDKGRPSSTRSEGQASGASSPVANTPSGSVMSLPSRSSGHDSNSLNPTDAHSIHAAIISSAPPVIPGQLLRSGKKDSIAPEGARASTRDSLVSKQDEATLHEGKFLAPHVGNCSFDQHQCLGLVTLAGSEGLDSTVGAPAEPAKLKDGTGFTEVPHLGEKREPGIHDNAPVVGDGICLSIYVPYICIQLTLLRIRISLSSPRSIKSPS